MTLELKGDKGKGIWILRKSELVPENIEETLIDVGVYGVLSVDVEVLIPTWVHFRFFIFLPLFINFTYLIYSFVLCKLVRSNVILASKSCILVCDQVNCHFGNFVGLSYLVQLR